MKPTIHNDEEGMRAALVWSLRGRGLTSPRPSVGCVIVRDGEILGGGHTQPGDGNPHAEVTAIRSAIAAGHDLTGATAYVTLEPCSHTGTTPPCTSALIAAGIARVVAGVRDPNRLIDGRGYNLLREAGIEVVEGLLEEECAQAQDHFLKFIATGKPFVTLKCAVSLDGKIATARGESQWITGEAARERGHHLRAEHDAILVGSNTVLADNPLLNVRLADDSGRTAGLVRKQPARIVLNSSAGLADQAPHLRLFDTPIDAGPVIIAVAPDAPAEKRTVFTEAGARVLEVGAPAGKIDLEILLAQLPAQGFYSVLIEGGAQVAASALEAGIVDKVIFFIAPVLIGGDGLDALAAFGVQQLADAPRLLHVQNERLGEDIMISGYTRPLPGTKEYVHGTR